MQPYINVISVPKQTSFITKEDTLKGVLSSDSVGVRTQDPQLRRPILEIDVIR
uniref:Uncharacterized protein n=1 Tax=Siphoviridae sp. cttU829 TaxID=2823605 RepID=A0A8S5LC35_9CAUD|nr:MAG TPA: hypothetical protein [Siphoviridae sp. cttU829]